MSLDYVLARPMALIALVGGCRARHGVRLFHLASCSFLQPLVAVASQPAPWLVVLALASPVFGGQGVKCWLGPALVVCRGICRWRLCCPPALCVVFPTQLWHLSLRMPLRPPPARWRALSFQGSLGVPSVPSVWRKSRALLVWSGQRKQPPGDMLVSWPHTGL